MLMTLFASKIARVLALVVAGIAVWKFNNGDVSQIVQSFITLLDNLSNHLIKVWNGFFN